MLPSVFRQFQGSIAPDSRKKNCTGLLEQKFRGFRNSIAPFNRVYFSDVVCSKDPRGETGFADAADLGAG